MSLGEKCIRKRRLLASPYPSACLFVYPHLPARFPLGADFRKNFKFGTFYENLSRKIQILLQMYRNTQQFTRREENVLSSQATYIRHKTIGMQLYIFNSDIQVKKHTHITHCCFYMTTFVTRMRHNVTIYVHSLYFPLLYQEPLLPCPEVKHVFCKYNESILTASSCW